MPEELRVDRPLGDRSTVHSDIGAVLADAILVDDLREVLLPHSTLPDNEYGHIRRGDLDRYTDSMVEEGTRAYDPKAMLDRLNIYAHLSV